MPELRVPSDLTAGGPGVATIPLITIKRKAH
jgi:hypothetical protein